jgi:hypothetical protein
VWYIALVICGENEDKFVYVSLTLGFLTSQLTPHGGILTETLRVVHLLKKYSAFMEYESSFQFS